MLCCVEPLRGSSPVTKQTKSASRYDQRPVFSEMDVVPGIELKHDGWPYLVRLFEQQVLAPAPISGQEVLEHLALTIYSMQCEWRCAKCGINTLTALFIC